MPISATGPTTIRRFAPGLRSQASGFTLLEILVVVAIVGIFIGVVTLSTDLVSFDRQMEREARRIESLIRLASEEALLQSQDLGLQFHTDGYSFVTYNHGSQTWQKMGTAGIWATHRLEGIELGLRVEDRDVDLESYEAFQSDWMNSRDRDSGEDEAEDERSREDEADSALDSQPPPPIVIFSSGEITPFELEVLNARDPFEPGYRFMAEFDGTIEIDRSEL